MVRALIATHSSLRAERNPMPRTPPKPYYSTTPWTGFTRREKKRDEALARCPSPACRRAKACQAAHEDLYCRRSHLSLKEFRARTEQLPRDLGQFPVTPTKSQMRAKRIMTDLLAAEAASKLKDMTERWKRGDLDDVYGKWTARGKLMQPPERQYTE
jgi:hypothetical protein